MPKTDERKLIDFNVIEDHQIKRLHLFVLTF